jgi:chloramphenicol 3-O phosphotransferase
VTLPQIILLNGASSSGKTTLAHALLNDLPAPYLYYSSDQLVEAGVLSTVDRSTDDTPWSWNVIRPRFFSGFHRSIAAFAVSNRLLVEHVVEYREWLDELVRLLSPFKVFYIGVFCPAEEVDRREAARGDRYTGEGRGHLDDGIHTWSDYDLEVDTHKVTPEENVRKILDAISRQGEGKTVFEILRRATKAGSSGTDL